MANSTYEILSVNFVFEPEQTICEVVCSAPSDGMLGVQGMHRKTFPASVSMLDIIHNDIAHAKYLTEW